MELKPITHFFNKRIYLVPAYQRGYSWHQKEILEMLTDIKHAIKLDSQHYTGTITIHPQCVTEKVGLSNYDIYHVVDGQQRLTTLVLILSHLIKELGKVNELKSEIEEKEKTYIINRGTYLFRYAIDQVSENFFRSLVLEKENLSSLEENLYTRNLQAAKKTIKEYFEMDEHKKEQVEYLNAIEEKLMFNEYIVSNSTEIGVVFETMNNRGIDLSNLEIVKNRLLYLTSKISLGEEKDSVLKNLSDDINTKWATILKNLTLPKIVLNEDTFLSNHWIIYHGWIKDNRAKHEILNEEFSIEKMVEDPEGMIAKIQDYIRSLATTSLYWRFINYPQEDRAFIEIESEASRSKLKQQFGKLNRLSNSTVRPLLLAFMPIMRDKSEQFLELAELAEVFSFRLFSMNKRRTDTGKNDIFRQCQRFHASYSDESTRQEALYYLSWYIDNYGDEARFKLEIEELFRSHRNEGYYSWKGLVYFLYEYEESKRGNEDAIVTYQFASRKKDSIEHVLPQTTRNTNWELVVDGLTPYEHKRLLHSIGNLVMIKASKNSSLRNSEFSIKRKSFETGSHSEVEISSKNRVWNKRKIEKREADLLVFLKERWGLDRSYLELYPGIQEITDAYEDEQEELILE